MKAWTRFLPLLASLMALHLLGLQLALALVGGVDPANLQWDLREGPLSAFLWLATPAAVAQAAALTLPLSLPDTARSAASLRARAFAAGIVLTLALALPVFALADLPYWLGTTLDDATGRQVFWALILGTGLTWIVSSLLLAHRATGEPDILERRVAQATAGTLVGLALATPWYLVLRRKQQCFCALGTFWALVAGLWSLVLVGGPTLLWLARERRRAALR
jgi:hypothetical protein